MNKILLISPHFDDAVLSAGQYMADRPDAEVVTVFGGFPLTPERRTTPYDRKCGFDHALDAVSERIRENNAATALLGATKIDLDFPDGQYGQSVTAQEITNSLQEILDKNKYDFIMGPIGLGHPDHLLTTEAIKGLKTDLPIYLWEDLPLRVVEPELVFERLKELGLTTKVDFPAGDVAKKMRSLACYKSQIGTGILDPYIMYVPERFWQMQ